jgi:hypothetical protein
MALRACVSVITVARWRSGKLKNRVRFPTITEIFLLSTLSELWGLPNLLCSGYRGPVGGLMRLGRESDNSPLYIAEVTYAWIELYTYFFIKPKFYEVPLGDWINRGKTTFLLLWDIIRDTNYKREIWLYLQRFYLLFGMGSLLILAEKLTLLGRLVVFSCASRDMLGYVGCEVITPLLMNTLRSGI